MTYVVSRKYDLSGTTDPRLNPIGYGTATELIVDGKPFLMLAGELGNNTAANLEHMKWVWPRLIDTKLNSVLAAVSGEEGVFVNGRWSPGRRLAGDDTGSSSLVLPRLHEDPDHPALFGPSHKGIQRVTLYRYQ